MGGVHPRASSAAEGFCSKTSVNSLDCKGLCVEELYCGGSSDEENVFEAMPPVDLGIFSTRLIAQELEMALSRILNADACGSCLPAYNEQKEMGNCVDGTDLCLDVESRSRDLEFDTEDEFSSSVESIDSPLEAENLTDECPTPLPATVKPVSAMKGSRTKQGTPPMMTKLSVKWSPDVYDPPVTSDSHTVKGYRRHKSKKDQTKNKHSKSKSSRSTTADKKHSQRRSTGSSHDSRMLRLRAYNDKLQFEGFGKSELDVDSVTSQELKFGSSCLVEPMPRVHLSVAEAS